MPRHSIGLDIGTFAVRAAELAFTSTGPRVVRFGQLTLPHGAVVAGEVIDPPAVAATLRRLWEGVGFRGRDVVLGLANQRVLVREAEMTAMGDQDITAALQFQDADILPVSPDEAYVDFQRLEDLLDSEGNQRVRLLVAAAQKPMVAAHLEVLQLAGLRAARLDPMPLALVRSIGTSGLAMLDEGANCEALVCIGSGVTTVVVHEGGIPRFVRFLTSGSGAATEAVMERMGLELDAAEAAKRAAQDPDVTAAVDPVVGALVEEVRSTIAFYVSQNPECPVGRVLLTGGGSRLKGLPERLSQSADLPVSLVPTASMYGIDAGLSADETARAEPNLPTVIGLALAAATPGGAMRRINLLPPTLATARTERIQTAVIGGAVAALAAVLLIVWLLKASQVSNEQSQAAADSNQQSALQQKLSSLSNTGATQGSLASTDKEIRTILAGDVDWASLITQVADAMPNDVWLTSFSGTRNAGAETVTFSGNGFSQTSAAQWLTGVGQLNSLSGLWVSSSARTGQDDLIAFSSTASLGPASNAGAAARTQRYTDSGPS
jgi:type IV pilus assembly protein PilM